MCYIHVKIDKYSIPCLCISCSDTIVVTAILGQSSTYCSDIRSPHVQIIMKLLHDLASPRLYVQIILKLLQDFDSPPPCSDNIVVSAKLGYSSNSSSCLDNMDDLVPHLTLVQILFR